MPITLGRNIFTLSAQRQLGNSSKEMSTVFERLSTGQRINKAADDSASLAIAADLTLNRRVLTRGVANLNDGISYLSIADSALGEMTSIVMRIKELAQQAANGTYSNQQRQPLQEEVNALQSEYNRIIQTTTFNNQSLLTGSNGLLQLQGGFGALGMLSAQIGKEMLSDAFGLFAAGTTSRVSTSSSGVQANAASLESVISADGRYVVFQSSATNLISGVSGLHIYSKDTQTGEIKLVSSNSAGATGPGNSVLASVSADGRYVSFTYGSNDLIPGATTGQTYRKDMLTGELIAVSTTQSGAWGNAVTTDSQISADGRYVVFRTTSSNLAAGASGTMQAYRKDLLTGELLLVSSSNTGLEGSGGSAALNRPTISADGRFVSFESTYANLVAGADGTNSQIFVKDMQTGQISVASSTLDGSVGSGGNSQQGQISRDGKYVSFRSAATNLVSGVTGWQIYRKNLETGAMEVVSTNEAGEFGTGGNPAFGGARPNMSANGRYVFFISDDTNLVAGVSGDNFFRKDMETGQIVLVSRSTEGTVGSALYSSSGRSYGVSADGLTAVFASNATNLITGDSNGVTDIYLRDLSSAGINQLEGLLVSDQAFARIALDATTKKLTELSSDRAKIGASISRLNTAVSNLSSTSENLTGAVGRIKDADIAEESSKLLRLKILQETTTAVLAQAKQQPALALQLLAP